MHHRSVREQFLVSNKAKETFMKNLQIY